MAQCVICTRDLKQGGTACDDCVTTLIDQLHTLPWLADELHTARTRQARLNNGSTAPKNDTPLGFNLAAANTADALHNTLVTWVRDLYRQPPTGVYWVPEAWPASDISDMVTWLTRRRHQLRNHPAVDQLAKDIQTHIDRALAVINPLADEQTYGVCGEETDDAICTAHLYGPAGVDWVRCKNCGTQHDARRRTQGMESRLRVLYFRAATLARILPRLIDRPVSAAHIRMWAREGKPIRTELDRDSYPTYHTGDVIDVALATPQRDRKKAG
jgi:hypothetical protein